MPDNRRVGSPKNNPGRMEPRSVPVQKDQARINDERKVRPHSSNHPAMGVRPSGGAQKEPVAPPDSLAGEYIQAREVPMATMTEAELNEWNPLARFFKSKQAGTIPGISVGYQVTNDGIDVYLLRDSRPIAHKRVDSHEAISNKMQQLNAEYKQLQQQRRSLSINPRRIGSQAAWDFAKEQGVKPEKVGELNREIPIQMGSNSSQNGQQQQQQQQGHPGQSGGGAGNPFRHAMQQQHGLGGGPRSSGPSQPSPRPPGGPSPRPSAGPGQSGPSGASWGHRGAGMQNPRQDFWNTRSGAQAGAPSNAPQSRKSHPASSPSEAPSPGNPAAAPGAMPLQNLPLDKIHEILSSANNNGVDKGFWTPERIRSASELNKRQAAHRFITGKHVQANKMAAEGIDEGYPDTSYEKEVPARTARIGDLGWKGKGKQPGVPGLNKNFMQARELRIEKVSEIANSDMDDMITRTMNRLGLEEAMHGGPEVDTISLPSHWASALVNGDFSGVEDEDARHIELMMSKLGQEGWHVVGTSDEEPRFTNHYQVHNPYSQSHGGEVMDFVIHRSHQHEPGPVRQFDQSQQFESYTGSAKRGPQGAAPIAETNLPRARARWV